MLKNGNFLTYIQHTFIYSNNSFPVKKSLKIELGMALAGNKFPDYKQPAIPKNILMKTAKQLINLLTLERVNEHTFIGQNYKAPWGRVFGGQVLAQSLHAAYQTVPPDRLAHSLHGYFILGGNIDIPITYEVDTIRNGGSFTTRRVQAVQNGKAIFTMAASFQLQQEGFDHQIAAPNVLPPEVLLSDVAQLKPIEKTDPELYQRLTAIHPNAIEFRPVEKIDPLNKGNRQPYRHTWLKTKEKIAVSLPMHHQLLAYASDFSLMTTAALPHRAQLSEGGETFFASLDHALWFHRDFRIDDWLLYATDSPSASHTRGFSRGSIFNRNGDLVASVAQEGLMRFQKSN
jgi:acyl-CoA thioesterase II